ncbi:MAG: ABC transporter ATP-binding protein [Euryarchaeota archaeon]|nr:ABC transporter ATP-binding protein [Euryarchaeota archaeon]
MITIEDVSSWYGDVIALNGVSARIETPVIGLLGPNGAGKSTLLSLLAGLRRPKTGAVFIDGDEPYDDPEVLKHIGLVPEPLMPARWLTGHRFVADLARMSGLGKYESRHEATLILKRLGLAHAMHRPIRGYSQGMRQRVKLAQALIHKPRLLLLDEPFTGLDPPGRAMMTRSIQDVAKEGVQVVFSSHVLGEVEAVTRDVLMLLRGRIVAHGSVRDVRARLASVPLRIGIRTKDPRKVAATLLQHDDVEGLDLRDGQLVVRIRHGTTFFRDLTRLGPKLPIDAYGPLDEDLESVYGLLVERRGRE